MPLPIHITRDLGPIGKGSSQAQVMADSNGNKYVVKFMENGQLLKILANEYVAGKIAEQLQLPCPSVHLVNMSGLLASTILPINGNAISTGPHFGSSMLNNIYTFPGIRAIISKCKNVNDFPLIILFDAMLYNADRNNPDNFIIQSEPDGYKFNVIDHGHCFGAYWDETLLIRWRGEWSDSYLSEMYETITSQNDFSIGVQRIAAIPNDFFSNLVNEIPLEWLPNIDERTALIEYLIFQRDNIKQMTLLNKGKFPNWS